MDLALLDAFGRAFGARPIEKDAVALPEGFRYSGVLSADGAARDIDAVGVRQGALESSNVSSATEMIALMSALRRAETGQRLIQVYDDLMGRTFNLLGQN